MTIRGFYPKSNGKHCRTLNKADDVVCSGCSAQSVENSWRMPRSETRSLLNMHFFKCKELSGHGPGSITEGGGEGSSWL